MEKALQPKDRTNPVSIKDRLESEDTTTKRDNKPQAMDDKTASCSEEHTSDADTDKSIDEDSIDIYVRTKKKVLRKRKRPQKRSSISNSATTTTTTTTTTTMMNVSSDENMKESLTKKFCNKEPLMPFVDNSTLTQACEPDKNAESLDKKIVIDTLDRVKQEANAMDQPVGADQQVPATAAALLAQRAEKSAGASGSGSSKYATRMARHEVGGQSGESSHDEDDSDIVGVAGGEGASTVTSELGMLRLFALC